jgi:hypothetical protein
MVVLAEVGLAEGVLDMGKDEVLSNNLEGMWLKREC